ncbi:WAT1-related protein At1g68170-like [Cynara cardunculus var. scolymus]|uniref:WAT1-related protein At1g68170-like n=1 Tax=Cynara cardunculus var. scolymus TaxID=59895 RepID=UPI000D627C96|nr:WAT1-related protein At1g68170-like [Cynara cardunculus var. scolymus]
MVMLRKLCNVIHELKPVLLMVAVQTTFAGVNVLYKLADNDGMKLPILVAYRFIFSTAFIVPLAIFVERKKRPKLTLMVLLQGFGCGLFGGALSQNLYVKALSLTSATFVSSINNLIPAITFLLAVCFRMERLGWNTSHGAAKIMGTVLGVGGAMLLTFYKGADLNLWKTNVDLSHGQRHAGGGQNSSSNMGLGSILVIGSCTSYSIWLIIQANMVKKYPCPYSVTALTSIMGAVQATVFGLCTNRHWRDWKLGWNVRLLTVAYSGMLASGLIYMFITLCVQMRGPLFVSAFNPLMLILVAIAGSLVLNERLHLGSVLGAILIVLGLYIVLWGKNKEVKKVAQLCPVRETIKELDNGAIVGESESSFGVGDGESKHLSVQSGNDESRRIVVTSLV